MARGLYIGINGKAKKINKIYVGVNGKARLASAIYAGVDNVARKAYGERRNSAEDYFSLEYSGDSIGVGFNQYDAYCKSLSTATDKPVDRSKFTNFETPTFQYSYDATIWFNYTLGTTINIGYNCSHEYVFFRGDNLKPWYDYYEEQTTETIDDTEKTITHYYATYVSAFQDNNQFPTTIAAKGNIMSLRYKNFQGQLTIPCDYAFSNVFHQCTVNTAPKLPATTLKPYCYGGSKIVKDILSIGFDPVGMFSQAALQEAPELPATVLAEGCYMCMFGRANSLATNWNSFEKPPILPATTLAKSCYKSMFAECDLTNTPTLSVTTLANECYYQMFYGCDRLTSTPTLPATTLTNYCYYSMFENCTGLTTPPTLSATTLADSCYAYMFENCTGLTSTPALPATTLQTSCYMGMFSGCTGLQRITKLPATDLPTSCYSNMFSGLRANDSSASPCTQAYRIPTSGTGTAASKSLSSMFKKITGDESFTPSINTTFYINATPF